MQQSRCHLTSPDGLEPAFCEGEPKSFWPQGAVGKKLQGKQGNPGKDQLMGSENFSVSFDNEHFSTHTYK